MISISSKFLLVFIYVLTSLKIVKIHLTIFCLKCSKIRIKHVMSSCSNGLSTTVHGLQFVLTKKRECPFGLYCVSLWHIAIMMNDDDYCNESTRILMETEHIFHIAELNIVESLHIYKVSVFFPVFKLGIVIWKLILPTTYTQNQTQI